MQCKVFWQYVLPHRLLSRLVYWATRWRLRPWKNYLIKRVVRHYDVDMHEAKEPDPLAYAHFNAFFTRKLDSKARPIPTNKDAILAPADGRISQLGKIENGTIFQAKGHQYTVNKLIVDEAMAKAYLDGQFATIYLSPRDYHRVHMPLAGRLINTTHIPGRLFSVAPFAVNAIPGLFARNERLVCHFEGHTGPFCLIMVGAMLVSSIHTLWDGLITPPYGRGIRYKRFDKQDVRFAAGNEMGHFNMGSTVIVLLPKAATLMPMDSQQAVKMGQIIGHMNQGIHP